MSSGLCKLSGLAAQVAWPSSTERGYTRRPPEGELIEKLFSNWRKGILATGVKKALSPVTPDFEAFCRAVIGDECPDFSICPETGPRILDDLAGIFKQPETWHLLSKPTRRSVVVLAALGKEGMRPGGYFRSDLAKIAGTKGNSPTERVAGRLCELNILERRRRRGRWPRFKFVRPDFLLKATAPGGDKLWDKEWRHWQRANDEYARRYVRRMAKRLDQLVSKKNGGFLEGKDYYSMMSGFLVGRELPGWYADILCEFMQLMVMSDTIPLKGPASCPDPREHWRGGEAEFHLLFERTASRLIEKIKAIPKEDERLWGGLFDLGDDDALIVMELPFGDRYNIDVERPKER